MRGLHYPTIHDRGKRTSFLTISPSVPAFVSAQASIKFPAFVVKISLDTTSGSDENMSLRKGR
jgi:hypothetical protein